MTQSNAIRDTAKSRFDAMSEPEQAAFLAGMEVAATERATSQLSLCALRQFNSAAHLSAFSSCSKADHPSILLQLGGGLCSKETGVTEIRNRSARVSA